MITVIIPMFNAEKNIIPLLDSLNLQTRPDFELIIVDDGSTDRSRELVEKNKTRFQFPLSLITQQNAGPAKARNVGVESAKGDIIIFLDSDYSKNLGTDCEFHTVETGCPLIPHL